MSDKRAAIRSPVTRAVEELREIVGEANVTDAPEDLVAYSYDAARIEHAPWAVVRPSDIDEIEAVVKLANRERFAVVARGAATGLTGGAVPALGGVVLDLARLNRILAIETENLTATVQPGVTTGELQREVEKRRLMYPPDPASAATSTIGGNVAENAGGLRGAAGAATARISAAVAEREPTASPATMCFD